MNSEVWLLPVAILVGVMWVMIMEKLRRIERLLRNLRNEGNKPQ
ncbi:hypothetical protein LCGC14_1901080 [marine sediment metagenome]|uniref:Uncharacterized protein n=1 Tax=marine sediment metagenome TaxID=412755 RepID=A0A0F9GK01_9ZZZZ